MTSTDNNELLGAALTEVRQLRIALEASKRARDEPIAIVGMACRVPGADDLTTFWKLLCDGRDMTRDIPADRFDIDAYYDPDPKVAGKTYTRRGAFLDNIDMFDAAFFGISPREAAQMDPQQRLFLEVAWEALEHAGQPIGKLAGSSTGVFMGVTGFDYSLSVMQNSAPSDLNAYSMTGGLTSTFAPGRLAYWLGLQGPSLAVDTACSSSLVAVHLAVQSLRSGDCTMALVGGVNVALSPEWFVVLSSAGMMAADGRCKAFDSAADGYVRGEGCGVVVLKPLSAALADHDRVLAVLRGSAVNQDGRSSGITVPNGTAQRAVIREALRRADVAGASIDYVEAHGTGTALGDPIEVHALADVLGEGRDPAEPIAIGSVKTNIGHLEPAAGVAGLIKTVLALRHEQIPPLLHLKELNPEIPADELPVIFPTTLTPWPRKERTRFAGLSSFGASGTNAHVVIEESPVVDPPPDEPDRPTHLVCLSARTGEALGDLVGRYTRHHAANPDESLADIAFTANRGRAHFTHRLAVRADDVAQLRARLADHAAGISVKGLHSGSTTSRTRLKVAFLFSGQGSQYQNMSRTLFDTQPGFRRDLEHCDELLRARLERPLLSVLFPRPGDEALINQTRYTQPALFALQYALARLWQRWGIVPAAMLGHSVGEYAAMCVAGVLKLEDGLALIAERARLMYELPSGGGMTALFADPERVAEALRPYSGQLSIAAVNAPENVVVTGARPALDELAARLAAEGVKSTPLRVSHAFHSPLIEPMLDRFESVCTRVSFEPPQIPLVSNLTGQVADSTTFTARYLRDQARQPVRFMAGLQQLAERGCRTFLEIGPTPVLCGMARHTLTDPDNVWLASLRSGQPDWTTMLDTLGELYARGADVDWEGFDSDYWRRRVDLPTYPFQRKRHWFQASAPHGMGTSAQVLPTAPVGSAPASAAPSFARPDLSGNGTATPVLGQRLPSPLEVRLYQATLTVDEHPGLDENVVDGTPVMNAGFYLEAALAASADLFGAEQTQVSQLLVPQALVMPKGGRQVTQVVVEPHEDEAASFGYYGLIPGTDDSWALYARGVLRPAADAPHSRGPEDLDEIKRRCPSELEGVDFYRDLWKRRAHLGPTARWLERISFGQHEALAWLRAPESGEAQPYRLHPGIVDSALQLVFACVTDELASDMLVILSELEDYQFYGYDGGQLLCHARLRTKVTESGRATADIMLVTDQGTPVASLTGAHMRLADRDALLQTIRTPPRPASAKVIGTGTPSTGRKPGPAAETANDTNVPGRLRDLLVECTAVILGSSRQDIDVHEPLRNLGFDSLMAVELRDAVIKELGINVPTVMFLDNPSVSELESELLSSLDGGRERSSSADRPPAITERTGPGGMHVAELGRGAPVVFVHGGAFGGVDAWQTQLPLAQRWRLVIPSRLNYGLSAASDREDFAEDARLIAELLGDGAHLVAQSYGTVGAMLAAAARPEAVWSLTLIESAASSVARSIPVVDDYERSMKALLESSSDDPEELFRAVFALIEPAARFPSPLPHDLRMFANRMRAIRWPWEADIPFEALRDVPFPTLVVTGGARPLFEEIGDALAKQLGGERLIVPGGHGTQNSGTPFNEALEDFLGRARPASAHDEAS